MPSGPTRFPGHPFNGKRGMSYGWLTGSSISIWNTSTSWGIREDSMIQATDLAPLSLSFTLKIRLGGHSFGVTGTLGLDYKIISKLRAWANRKNGIPVSGETDLETKTD